MRLQIANCTTIFKFAPFLFAGQAGFAGQAWLWAVWVKSGPLWVGVGKLNWAQPTPKEIGRAGSQVNSIHFLCLIMISMIIIVTEREVMLFLLPQLQCYFCLPAQWVRMMLIYDQVPFHRGERGWHLCIQTTRLHSFGYSHHLTDLYNCQLKRKDHPSIFNCHHLHFTPSLIEPIVCTCKYYGLN